MALRMKPGAAEFIAKRRNSVNVVGRDYAKSDPLGWIESRKPLIENIRRHLADAGIEASDREIADRIGSMPTSQIRDCFKYHGVGKKLGKGGEGDQGYSTSDGKYVDESGISVNSAALTAAFRYTTEEPNHPEIATLENFSQNREARKGKNTDWGNFRRFDAKTGARNGDEIRAAQDESTMRRVTDVIRSASLRMRVPMKYITDILESGRLMNQIEIAAEAGTEEGHSRGMSYVKGRMQASNVLFGTDMERFGKQQGVEYERYGYLQDHDDYYELFADEGPSGYGSLSFEFKKDKLIDRTTYTVGDSLSSGALPQNMLGQFDFYSVVRYTDFVTKEQLDAVETISDIRKVFATSYVEAQYHGGPLTLDYVETLYISPYALSRLDREQLIALRESGIKLTYLEQEKVGSKTVYHKKGLDISDSGEYNIVDLED